MSEDAIHYESLSAEVTGGVLRVVRSYVSNVTYDRFCDDMTEGKKDSDTHQQFERMRKCPVEYYHTLDKNARVRFCNALQNGPSDKPAARPAKKAKTEKE